MTRQAKKLTDHHSIGGAPIKWRRPAHSSSIERREAIPPLALSWSEARKLRWIMACKRCLGIYREFKDKLQNRYDLDGSKKVYKHITSKKKSQQS